MGIFGLGNKKDTLDDLKVSKNKENNISNKIEEDPFKKDSFNSSHDNFGKHSDPFLKNEPSGHQDNFNNSFSSKPSNAAHLNPSISDYSSSPSNQIPPELKKEEPKSHDMELLSSKLDVIKSMIENLTQRVNNLENKITYEQEKRKSW